MKRYDPQKVAEIEEEELQKRLQAELDDEGNQAQSAEDIQAENDACDDDDDEEEDSDYEDDSDSDSSVESDGEDGEDGDKNISYVQ